jgi:hypothetical protein
MKTSPCLLPALIAFFRLSLCLGADRVTPPQSPGDPDLPQPIDSAAAQEILANSPFTRSLDLSHTLQLTGIAYVEGHPMATFFNRETKRSFVLSDEPKRPSRAREARAFEIWRGGAFDRCLMRWWRRGR